MSNIENIIAGESKNIQMRFNNIAAAEIGILSLTQVCDDILMWAHYADLHKGFVIEFNSSSEFFHKGAVDDEFGKLRSVVYSNVRPAFSAFGDLKLDAFITKSTHWAYENEVRMLLATRFADQVIDTPRGTFHLFSFPPEAISSITLGCRIAADTRHEILQIIKSDPCLEKLEIFQAEPDPTVFRLNISRYAP